MPRINLLPVRAARQIGQARRELIVFAGLVLGLLVVLYGWYAATESEIGSAKNRLTDLGVELTALEKAVAQVDEFKLKAGVLERKLEVIEVLKRKKIGPAKMLSDLADIFTRQRKIWLTSFEEKNGLLILKGGAMEQENISEFQLAMELQTKFFSKITLTLVSSANEVAIDHFQWTITCRANYAAS